MRQALVRFLGVALVGLGWLSACGADPSLELATTGDPGDALRFEDAAHHCGSFVLTTPLAEGTCSVDYAVVRNYNETVYQGRVDVTACVARIEAGQRLPYRHDGTVFRNAEHRLPQAPAGTYHEYVDPTPGLDGPGPQRIVWGGLTDWYYSPDHYETFLPVHCVQTM